MIAWHLKRKVKGKGIMKKENLKKLAWDTMRSLLMYLPGHPCDYYIMAIESILESSMNLNDVELISELEVYLKAVYEYYQD